MSTTYTQKQSTAQKKDAPSASSVLDASSQGESLHRKADLTNDAAQRAANPRPNNTGMPDNLKAGIESLSGFSMDDVRVHYNSSKPATVQALAYTQGTDIHVAPGQEKCLPHEAWHVAQQMAGRVSPTTNINGMPVNDNAALEHEADVMGEKAVQMKSDENDAVQCASKLANSFGQPIQRTIKHVDINDYVNAYGSEIHQTGTLTALLCMVRDYQFYAANTKPLRFTDDYSKCGVMRMLVAPYSVLCIKIPDPQAPVDYNCENVKNLSSKLSPKQIKSMFAIHELEHLRLFYKNSGGNLNNMNVNAGEPSVNPTIMTYFVLLKKNICERLREKIPQTLNKKLKDYIGERLGYIMRPKSLEERDDSTENKTARELTTVLIELKKFCENYHASYPREYERLGMDEFENEVSACYNRWR